MPLGLSHAVLTTMASSRATSWSSPEIMEHCAHGRNYISNCGTVVVKVRCKVVTPGDTGCSSDMKTLNTCSGARVQQAAVRTSKILIREAYLTEYWDVSDTHCGAFFPNVKFPMDFILRGDRAMTMLGNLTVPSDQKRICLVALEAVHLDDLEVSMNGERANLHFPFLINTTGDEAPEKVSGALTMDTLAEFLPRRKPMNRRRTGIAYVSNVAVRPLSRRRGIARRLMSEAQDIAREWGCRSLALHVDVNNAGAVALYLQEGFKRVKIPGGAKWPQPQALPGANLQLMMKHLGS